MLDAKEAINSHGEFNMAAFQKYILSEMSKLFGYEMQGGTYHPAEIALHLRNEPASLFCLFNVHVFCTEDFRALRGLGFTQSQHRVLYCGKHPYLELRRFPAFGLRRTI